MLIDRTRLLCHELLASGYAPERPGIHLIGGPSGRAALVAVAAQNQGAVRAILDVDRPDLRRVRNSRSWRGRSHRKGQTLASELGTDHFDPILDEPNLVLHPSADHALEPGERRGTPPVRKSINLPCRLPSLGLVCSVFMSDWLKWPPCGRTLVGIAPPALARRTVRRGIIGGWLTPERERLTTTQERGLQLSDV
jgi:hypothetical protein